MVNTSKVQGQTTVKDGDEVMFGSPKSVFIAVYEPLVVSTSCLSPTLKKQVQQSVMKLGGHIVAEWSRHCTLLVMTSISVTIKVVCAMVSLKPIVSPDYLAAYLQSLESGKEQPDPESYLPTVSESQIDPTEVSFTNNTERKKIFEGKTFIFLQQKQFQKMSLAVELGGGMPLLMETRPKERSDQAILTHKNTVVMNCGLDVGAASEWKEWYRYVEKTLARHKQHMSQDAELGLAVLHCDTDQYCNPCVDFASQGGLRLPSQSLSQAPVFTQTQKVIQEETTLSPTQPAGIKSSCVTLSVKSKESQRTKVPGQGHKDTDVTYKPSGQSSHIDRSQHSGQKQAQSPPPKRKPDKSATSPTRRSPRSKSLSPVPDKDESFNLRSRSPASPGSRRLNLRSSPVPEVVTDTSTSRGPLTKRGVKPSPRMDKNDETDIVDIKKEKNAQKTKSRPGKQQIIEDDSDEDYGFTRKSKKQRDNSDEVRNEDNPFDWTSRKSTVKMASNSEKGLKKERDDDFIILDPDSETEDNRGKTLLSGKCQEVRVSDSDSDSGSGWAGKGKSRSPIGQKGQQAKSIVEVVGESQKLGCRKRKLDDSSDEEDKGQKSRRKIKQEPGISPPLASTRGHQGQRRMEEQEHEQTGRQEVNAKQERITPRKTAVDRTVDQETVQTTTQKQEKRRELPSVSGFLSAVRGQAKDEYNHHSNYVKEEGIPTDLVQTVFVDLMIRRPSQTKKSPQRSNTDVPPGYSPWKGCIVKNFKKFKKAGVASLDRLPKIIGGSGLIPHVTSQRQELDEWFREAQQAESQQSEANRRAQELFEWEPRSHSSNRSRL
ncbi:nibrin-like isoform X2 [Ylistrum balloti]|nr:nibrin-like isoform X2 [Ylistrum balloti]XP_060072739.1 nibrin-like isoform X2 [Ylistrum balloti]XP_060072740.1 nibrin-like isoform X2 [Ylistrum balloti]